MAPLNWAQGEYINLLADIAAGEVLDIPLAVCSRYHACIAPPAPGQVAVDISVNAATQFGQYMYVTGDAAALGASNPISDFLSIRRPIRSGRMRSTSPSAAPFNTNTIAENPDGGVTWECYPAGGDCNGNRSLTAPSSGPLLLNETVNWN